MKKLAGIFKASALASVISVTSINETQAEPFTKFKNTSGKTEIANCGRLVTGKDMKGRKRLFMTCDFAEQIKPKGEICSGTDSIPTKLDVITNEQIYILTQETYGMLKHLATKHNGDCARRAAGIEGKAKVKEYMGSGMSKDDAKTKALNEINKDYGTDWRDKKSCSIENAINACSAALSID